MTSTITPNPAPAVEIGRFSGASHRPLMAMIEINNRCNMNCPICFTDARAAANDLELEKIVLQLDMLLETAGPVPLQISGGEPTLHPQLPEIVGLAQSRGFKNIELVTNGIVISRKPGYLAALVDRGMTAVYLQFDGLRKKTLETIRGQDMREVRTKSVEIIREAKICCTLAVAVVPQVNDQELGEIVDFGISNIDTVRAINFQSATPFAGRYKLQRAERGYTLAEIIQLVESQCDFASGGFVSDILGHPHCNAMSLLYVVNGQLKPLFSYISEKTRRDFFKEEPRQVLLDLFGGKDHFCRKYLISPSSWAFLREAFDIFGKEHRLQSILSARHILLFAKSFMDGPDLDLERLDQCCYGITSARGVYSFCAYNNLHRFSRCGGEEA